MSDPVSDRARTVSARHPWAERSFWLLVWLLVFVGVGTLVDYSKTFTDCIHDHKNDKDYHQLREGVGVSSGAVKRTETRARLLYACAGDFTDKNNGAIVAFATVMVGFFTFTLWRSTYRLWQSSLEHAGHAERAIKVSEQSAERQLRAYVTMSGFEATAISDANGRIMRWRFAPTWENAGQTPTRRGRNHINWSFFSRGDLPDDSGFADLGGPLAGENAQLVIGPRTKVGGEAAEIDVDWLWASIALQATIFIWGWTEYDDLFADETPRHRTEFCSYLRWTTPPDIMVPGGVSLRVHSAFNGADEDCYREPTPRIGTTPTA
jgi:hypothetical protein